MNTTYDAIVVGAGPAGTTAAIRLASAGWSVALVERRPFPRRKVCGECIAATNLPLLDALGVGGDFDTLAGPELRRVGLFTGAHRIEAPLPPLPGARRRWGRALGREHLDTLLLHRAQAVGVHVWQPWAVKRLLRVGQAHACEIVQDRSQRAQTLRAGVLVEAHGSWEPDPGHDADAAPRAPRRDGDLFAFKGTFRNAAIEPGLLPVLAFQGGYGGMVLGDHGQTTLAFCLRRDALRDCRARAPGEPAPLAALAHVERHCHGVRSVLAGSQREERWLGVGPLQPGVHGPTRGRGVFAVGNAAGEAHPILGEGISMALQSAWLLGDLLIAQQHELQRAAPDAAALDRVAYDYARAWRRHFAPRIRFAAACAHLAMRPGAASALVPLLQRLPALLTQAARLGGKVRPLAVSPTPPLPYAVSTQGIEP